MAQYFDVKYGLIMWINGRNHLQLEPVPTEQVAPHIDCRTLSQSNEPSLSIEAVRHTMQALCNEEGFDIMDL